MANYRTEKEKYKMNQEYVSESQCAKELLLYIKRPDKLAGIGSLYPSKISLTSKYIMIVMDYNSLNKIGNHTAIYL